MGRDVRQASGNRREVSVRKSNRTILNDYFKWLYSSVCSNKNENYLKLLSYLNDVEFVAIVPMDENRIGDGLRLRDIFIEEHRIDEDAAQQVFGNKPCSVLEMMVALAIRCERDIMSNSEYGDRTVYWFWTMINNLGLSDMDDDHFDPLALGHIIYVFLNRTYDKDGRGGLFRISDPTKDMRKTDIWYQMCYYLNEMVEV